MDDKQNSVTKPHFVLKGLLAALAASFLTYQFTLALLGDWLNSLPFRPDFSTNRLHWVATEIILFDWFAQPIILAICYCWILPKWLRKTYRSQNFSLARIMFHLNLATFLIAVLIFLYWGVPQQALTSAVVPVVGFSLIFAEILIRSNLKYLATVNQSQNAELDAGLTETSKQIANTQPEIAHTLRLLAAYSLAYSFLLGIFLSIGRADVLQIATQTAYVFFPSLSYLLLAWNLLSKDWQPWLIHVIYVVLVAPVTLVWVLFIWASYGDFALQ